MRARCSGFALVFAMVASIAAVQVPPPAPPPAGGQRPQPGAPPNPQQQFRRVVETITLSSSAWADGGSIPAKHTQVGGQVSPPLTWSAGPDGTMSYVVIVHDVDTAVGNGTDDMLHWLLWNIPASARGIGEGQPQGPQLPDGTRQISATGPYFRGPGAAAAGPAHHYVFEVYAVDSMINVPAVGASPPETRAAVIAAMAGHIRGKGVYVGLFKR
jgi:Raf kinase inhibitor-like YbhB/YbcL family protein